jgi:hypothetical protein
MTIPHSPTATNRQYTSPVSTKKPTFAKDKPLHMQCPRTTQNLRQLTNTTAAAVVKQQIPLRQAIAATLIRYRNKSQRFVFISPQR